MDRGSEPETNLVAFVVFAERAMKDIFARLSIGRKHVSTFLGRRYRLERNRCDTIEARQFAAIDLSEASRVYGANISRTAGILTSREFRLNNFMLMPPWLVV